MTGMIAPFLSRSKTMSRYSNLLAWLIPGILLTIAGCQAPLNVEQEVQVPAGGKQYVMIDAPVREQKIKVAANSGGVPITLAVVLGANEAEADKALATPSSSALLVQAGGEADPL
jgi:hypothetical protein